MIVGVPEGDQGGRVPGGDAPRRRRGTDRGRAYRPDRGGGRAGQRDRRRPVRGGRRDDRRRTPPRSGRGPTWSSRSRSRSRRSGRCMRPRPDALHLLPLRRRRGADPRRSSTAGSRPSPTRRSATPAADLPLLTPMSEVAGRMSIQEGAKYLERPAGRAGHPAGGRAGRRPGRGRHPRRRDRRLERRQGRRRARGQRPDPRRQPRPAPLPRRHHAAERHDALFRPPHDPRVDRAGRPRHRRRS